MTGFTLTATATDKVTGAAGTATGTFTVSTGLPAGVTLQQIDGGPAYYASNGFTYAHNAGWDDPSFFPIATDYPFYPSNSPAVFKDLGLNFAHRLTGDTDLALLRSNGIWALPSPGDGTGDYGAETIGWHIEEPASWSDVTSQVTGLGSLLTGRLLQISNTWNQFVYGAVSGTPGSGGTDSMMTDLISTSAGSRHLNVPGDDIYWFAGSGTWLVTWAGGLIYTGQQANCTADQAARGSNYGDMVDQMRGWVSVHPAPIAPYIETEDGLITDTGARRITPPELNWAVWSTLVHGARWILYFGTTSNYGSVPTFGFPKTVLSGQQVSIYAQAKATNTLVTNLARILNSPFALNYASVSPKGYVFPVPHVVFENSIDIMAKYYTGGSFSNAAGSFINGFYVFATVRGSEKQSNVKATFTTADKYTGPVTVVGENRTVQATGGVFADTFATAATVHIYKIGT
jgi:hypothetical protein